MTKYRILDTVDPAALNGQRVQIDVSDQFIILKPLKPGLPSVILAQAVKPRRASANGQPAVEPEPALTEEPTP